MAEPVNIYWFGREAPCIVQILLEGIDMSQNKRKTIEGWIDKASNQLNAAREHVKSVGRYSEAIQAAQQCVELSVKSVLTLLNVNYSRIATFLSSSDRTRIYIAHVYIRMLNWEFNCSLLPADYCQLEVVSTSSVRDSETDWKRDN
jgi:hypothetical protein